MRGPKKQEVERGWEETGEEKVRENKKARQGHRWKGKRHGAGRAVAYGRRGTRRKKKKRKKKWSGEGDESNNKARENGRRREMRKELTRES